MRHIYLLGLAPFLLAACGDSGGDRRLLENIAGEPTVFSLTEPTAEARDAQQDQTVTLEVVDVNAAQITVR